MALDNCPKELQNSVLEWLPPADLFSMSLLNKEWHVTTESTLYSGIEMTWTTRHMPSIPLLLRSLIERPELADCVRSLRLNGVGFSSGRYAWASIPKLFVNPDDITQFSETIDQIKADDDFADLWKTEIKDGVMDGFVALLVTRLHNLTFLRLDANFTINYPILGFMFAMALCGPSGCDLPRYLHLHHVEFVDWPDRFRREDIENTDYILPFFYLPDIRHLKVTIDNPDEFWWLRPAVPTVTSLISLELNRLREPRLEPLFAALKSVQRIKWNWLYRYDIDPEVSKLVIEFDKITAALHHVRGTLTDLTIHAETLDVFCEDHEENEPLKTEGSLDGLIHMEKLERLEIPWVFIMGFSPADGKHLRDAIPDRTETLTLTSHLFADDSYEWGSETIASELKSELEYRKKTRSNLRHIHIQLFPLAPRYFNEEDGRMELEELATQARIQLTWPL